LFFNNNRESVFTKKLGNAFLPAIGKIKGIFSIAPKNRNYPATTNPLFILIVEN